jgi:hypothetical protein
MKLKTKQRRKTMKSDKTLGEMFGKLEGLPINKAENIIETELKDHFEWLCVREGRKLMKALMLSCLESIPPEKFTVYDLLESTYFRLDNIQRQARRENCAHLFRRDEG